MLSFEQSITAAALIGLLSCQAFAAKPLNNFVAELLDVPKPSQPVYKFTNPRDGWILVRSTARPAEGDIIRLGLDSAAKGDAIITHASAGGETFEAMRLLPAGQHTIHVVAEGSSPLGRLTVRSIPEIGFMALMSWDLLEKHRILDNINVLVDHAFPEHRKYLERWKQSGKRAIVMFRMPGFTTDKTVKLEDTYTFWAKALTENPAADAFQADEIAPELPDYAKRFPVWADAMRKIAKEFPGKSPYLYCCGPILTNKAAESLRPIIDALDDSGGKLLLEAYLTEKPTLEAARAHIKERLLDEVPILKKAYPNFPRNTILAVGTYDKFGPELDACPNADFRVFLDMQFQVIATDPAWQGLYGIQNYMSYHMWEETQRWVSLLFRHYCIKGKTELLSRQYGYSYILPHLANPDFEEGDKAWTRDPAAKGSMKVIDRPGLAWAQGRYDVDTHEQIAHGNKCMWTRRGADRPNAFSQTIRHLRPGESYSVRIWVGDHNDLPKKQSVAFSVRVEDADPVPDKNVDWSYMLTTDAYFTYAERVFVARGETAKLVVSDWADEKQPGGAIGQELMCNFVELQSYLKEGP